MVGDGKPISTRPDSTREPVLYSATALPGATSPPCTIFLFFFHLTLAPNRPMAESWAAVNFLARAGPPFFPPATAIGFFFLMPHYA